MLAWGTQMPSTSWDRGICKVMFLQSVANLLPECACLHTAEFWTLYLNLSVILLPCLTLRSWSGKKWGHGHALVQVRLKNPPSNSCHGKLASSGERLLVVWEEEKAGSAVLGCPVVVGRRLKVEAGTVWAHDFSLCVTLCFAPLSPSAIAIIFNQWGERKYLTVGVQRDAGAAAWLFWGGLSCRWTAGRMHRCKKGVSQELLRQWEIKLQQCIIFLLSAHPPKRLLPHEWHSHACVCICSGTIVVTPVV